jgi:NADPH:quinone reductase-like Zn-dependent oxidoreductase
VEEALKAIIFETYGPPSVLQLREVEAPTPRDHQVLIKVHATTVSSVECAMRNGDPLVARIFIGLLKPICTTPGEALAGEVVAVGKDVRRLKVGDRVFGSTKGAHLFVAAGQDWGACAQYKCLPEGAALAQKPANVTDAEIAGICEGALTALPFLRDVAGLQRGQRILVNGASGSVGTIAVQLARHFGAEVTGVCSTANLELVRSLGAHQVIDYTREDFSRSGQAYDVIFDAVGMSSFSRCRGALGPHGLYMTTRPTLAVSLQMLWTSRMGGKRAVFAASGLRSLSEKTRDLEFLRELVEAGKLRPVIDRSFTLEQIVEAHRYVEQGHKKGSVVVAVQPAGSHPGALPQGPGPAVPSGSREVST